MKSSVRVEIKRESIVPSCGDGRVQWLETHGVIPAKIAIECVAEIAEWAAAGVGVSPAGEIELYPHMVADTAIHTALEGHLRADPTSTGPYDVTPILRAVVAAREAKRAEEAADKAREEARMQAVADELAAIPVDAILSPAGEYLAPTCSRHVQSILEHVVGGGAWFRDRASELATDTIDALRETQRTRREAERERVREAEAAGRAAVRAWAVEQGDAAHLPTSVVRAAREGRDVSRVVRDEIDRRVLEACQGLIPASYRSQTEVIARSYGQEADARVPSPRAYDVRDAIVEGVDEIATAAMVPGVTVEVSDFRRVDVAEEKRPVWRSGFDVSVRHPWWPGYDLGCVVLTEPLAHSPESDEE